MPLSPHYEAVLASRTPNQSASPTLDIVDRIIELDHIGWSRELNGEGQASVSTRPERVSNDLKPYLQDPDNNPSELWIFREGTQVYAGPVVGIQIQGGHNTITLHSRGLLYYLRGWFVTTDLEYVDTDQFTIGKNLVDHWQALDYGNFGIDTSAIGTSGVLRTRRYWRDELPNIGAELAELSQVDNGFDYVVEPDTRDLVFYNPQKGSDKSGIVIVDNRVLMTTSLFIDLTAGDFASEVLATGTGFLEKVVYTTKSNTTLRQNWGRWAVGANFDGVGEQTATLDDYAQELVDIISKHRFAVGEGEGGGQGFVPVEGLEPVVDIDTGDTITWAYDVGYDLVTLQRDVLTVQVSVGQEGEEQVSLMLT